MTADYPVGPVPQVVTNADEVVGHMVKSFEAEDLSALCGAHLRDAHLVDEDDVFATCRRCRFILLGGRQ